MAIDGIGGGFGYLTRKPVEGINSRNAGQTETTGTIGFGEQGDDHKRMKKMETTGAIAGNLFQNSAVSGNSIDFAA